MGNNNFFFSIIWLLLLVCLAWPIAFACAWVWIFLQVSILCRVASHRVVQPIVCSSETQRRTLSLSLPPSNEQRLIFTLFVAIRSNHSWPCQEYKQIPGKTYHLAQRSGVCNYEGPKQFPGPILSTALIILFGFCDISVKMEHIQGLTRSHPLAMYVPIHLAPRSLEK